MALGRINNELIEYRKNPPKFCSIQPDENDMMYWRAKLVGPSDSPYEGGIFNIDIKFSRTYPYQAPDIKFTTKEYI